MAVWTQQLQGARATKAARIPVSAKVTVDAVSCREELVGATAHTFVGPARFFRPNGPCDAVATKAERFFHDVSRYGGGPVTPSKISMMIICP